MAGIDNNTLLYLRGDSFTDLSSNSNVLVNNDVSILSDNTMIKCFQFNGSSSYFTLNDVDIFNLGTSDFTFEFWVKFPSLSLGNNHIFGKRSSGRANHSYTCNMDDNTIFFMCSSDGGVGSNIVSSPMSNFTINKWHHISFVRYNNIISMFIDGKLINSGAFVGSLYNSTEKLKIGAVNTDAGGFFNGCISNIRISNVARYTENFTPPTQPYNSITINKTNQTDTNIEFSVTKLGQEAINKVEVLVNGTVSETYIDNYDNINYLIDTELCMIGNNDITIRVTYDDTYTEELSLTHKVTVNPLPLETPLLDTVERVKLLTELKQTEKDTLSSILTSKNVEVTEEDKMSDLIGKIDLLGEYDNPILYLYKDGDECASITGGWEGTNFSTFSKGTLTKNSDNINLTCPSGNYWIVASTTNKVDITKYSKLKVEYKGNVRTSYGVSTSINPCNFTSYSSTNTSYNGIVEHNISSLSGSYYVNVGSEGSANINIYKVWLEK